MGLRPARCYRTIKRPYTRISIRKPRRSYVKGVPQSKITKFEMGVKKPYSLKGFLVAKNSVQIRHNALEASRIALNKVLEKEAGKENYFLKILVYPHNVLRENPIATGAGADRFQTGMSLAFGRPIGTAAQVKAGQKLIEVNVDKAKQDVAKKALKIAASKMPTSCRIEFESVAA